MFAPSPSIPISSPLIPQSLRTSKYHIETLASIFLDFCTGCVLFQGFHTAFHNRHVCVISEDEKSLEVGISQKFLLFVIALDHALSLVIVLGVGHQAKT